jgi:hypothetical protein
MTVALITRELIVVARRPVLVAAVALYVALLASFALIWGLKLPALTGASFFEILRVFHWGLLATLMPWVVARCHALDRGDRFVMLSALVARRPSSIVLAKVLSLAGVLALIAVAGAPAVIIAAKMSALPFSAVTRDLASALSVGLLSSAITIAWILRTGDALASWIGGTVTMAAVLTAAARLTPAPAARDLSMLVVAAAVTAAAATWSDRAFQYCHE